MIDVTAYGATGDGTTDDSGAFTSAIAAVSAVTSPWSDSRTAGQTEILVPAPSVAYRLVTEVTIPTTKSVAFVGEGSNGSRITSDVNYAFFVDSPTGSFLARSFTGILFDQCGVRVDTQTRNRTEFINCFFAKAPDYAIKLQSSDLALGSSGGVVGGAIVRCEFEGCAGGIVCQGDQSDGWRVHDCRFSKNTSADIKVYSSGWHISGCTFEQRTDADVAEPYINIGNADTTDILIEGNRFGNEVGSGTQPPQEAIIVGPIGSSESASITDIRIINNMFRGRAGGGPTSTSANVAVRFNSRPYKCKVTGNVFYSLNTARIQFGHTATNDGDFNIFDAGQGTALVDTFTPRKPSTGDFSSWSLPGALLSSIGTRRAVADMDDIADSSDWTKSNCTIAKDATDYEGVSNNAFTITKSASGTAYVSRALPASDEGLPVVCSARFKKPSGSSISTARFYAYNSTANLYSVVNSRTFNLGDNWERHWFTVYPDAGDVLTIYIAPDDLGGSATGDMEVDDIRIEFGELPSTGPRYQRGTSAAVPTTGAHLAGDMVYKHPPAKGITGWICSASGVPGTWLPFGRTG